MRAIACLAALGAASLSFANLLEYTFDTDNEGWQRGDLSTGVLNIVGPAVWDPAGYIQADDFSTKSYHVSPDLGGLDASAAYGTAITFDLEARVPNPNRAPIFPSELVFLASSTDLIY